jgi:hypothetical protein
VTVSATDNTVEGNYIGTNASSTAALGNSLWGVLINSGTNNTIGGTVAGGGNVVSGNSHEDVAIQSGLASGNVVQGNFIGTDKSGTVALGNPAAGVDILQGAYDNLVGGTTVGARNIISGNEAYGFLTGDGAGRGNVVQGNYIGTDLTGNKALSNQYGVLVQNPGETIGGTMAGAGNLISGNTWVSVGLKGNRATNDLIEGNAIGIGANSTTALGNNRGILIDSGASNNTIGGTMSGAGNGIAYNSGAGVAVTGTTSTGNAIRGNLIYSNIGLGIDLGDTGTILANDSQGHSGPNNYANYPVLTSVTAGPITVVSGTLQNASTPGTIYYLDFYANTTQNPSGHGDAQVYLGSTTVTTDSTGLATFSAAGLGATTNGQ